MFPESLCDVICKWSIIAKMVRSFWSWSLTFFSFLFFFFLRFTLCVHITEGVCACMQGLVEDRSVKYPGSKVTGCWSGCWEWNHGPLHGKRKPQCCPKGHMNKAKSHLPRHFFFQERMWQKLTQEGEHPWLRWSLSYPWWSCWQYLTPLMWAGLCNLTNWQQ